MSSKRSSSGRDKTFGAPKPLPGQPGYKVPESAVLEKEAKEMELRLQMLQERLIQQQIETEKTQITSGGTRWKSSNPDKGSIRAYGKEVSEKVKTKILERDRDGVRATGKLTFDVAAFQAEEPPPLPPRKFSSDPSHQTMMSSSADSSLAKKRTEGAVQGPADVTRWSTADVCRWLAQLELSQYKDIFSKNEINGEVLVDLTLDDLDYLQITVLAHRKTLMKAVEEIRRQLKSSGLSVRQSLAPSSLQRPQSASLSVSDDSDRFVGASVKKESAPAKPVHWSQLEPLSAKQVKGGSQSVNAADDEPFDEEKERLAFMQAVEEWRKSDSKGASSKVSIVREYAGEKASSSSHTTSEAKISSFSFASGDGGEWKNPFAPAEPSPRPAAKNDSSLLQGQLDEDHEHAEFVKAVEAWRSNKAAASSSGPASVSVSESSVGDSAPLRAKSIAQTLAEQMEQEQQAVVQRMLQQKEDARRRLAQANEELLQLRSARDPQVFTPRSTVNSSRFEGKEDVHDARPLSAKKTSFDDSDEEESAKRSVFPEREEAKVEYTPPPSTVRIAIVESIIGTEPGAVASSEDGGCVVEYDSD